MDIQMHINERQRIFWFFKNNISFDRFNVYAIIYLSWKYTENWIRNVIFKYNYNQKNVSPVTMTGVKGKGLTKDFKFNRYI